MSRNNKGVCFGLVTGVALSATFITKDTNLFISTMSIALYSFFESHEDRFGNDSFGNGFFYGFVGSQLGAYALGYSVKI